MILYLILLVTVDMILYLIVGNIKILVTVDMILYLILLVTVDMILYLIVGNIKILVTVCCYDIVAHCW